MVGFGARVGVGLTAIVALAVARPTTSGAQGKHVVGGGRVAGIAPPPPVVVQPGNQPSGFDQFSSPISGSGTVHGRVPVVVLPDGRVFANFGYGYEQVVRTCSSSVVIQPNAAVQSGPVQPVVTQPAPAQATASEQMLGVTRPGAHQQADLNPCWSSQAGMIYVFRR